MRVFVTKIILYIAICHPKYQERNENIFDNSKTSSYTYVISIFYIFEKLMDADVYDPELAKNKQRTMFMYVAMAVGIIVLIVLMRWIIARINYKMYQVRQNFRPTLTWIVIGLVVLIIASILIFYVLNQIGKQGAYKKHYTPDEEDLQRPES